MDLTLHEYMETLLALDSRMEVIEKNMSEAHGTDSFEYWMERYTSIQSAIRKIKQEGWE